MFDMSDGDSINGDKDEYVQALSKRNLRRIDRAFNAAVNQNNDTSAFDSPSTSSVNGNRRRSQFSTAPGGFIVEDEPGGFILERAVEEVFATRRRACSGR